ncbi:methyl-accepting chemotaxis protein [Clostridium sp. C2-6-12]|uniref:methyl-accepting chemotaxis protein n=1 Tax=Clostridium sp. C2-6-12 TaxID=2698832 RepID=UPI00136DF6C7|nr:methyl-accepting chemotaxis protein [Clostridium sp. C2-6-12]
MKISLKAKLMAAFLILISVPMWVLGYSSYTMSSKALQASVQQQLKEQTYDTSLLIQKTIDSVKLTIKTASLNHSLVDVAKQESSGEIDNAFEYIQDIQKENQDYIEALVITNDKGKVIIDSQSKNPNTDLSDRDYMKKALSTGKETVSEVVTSKVSNKPVVTIAYPLKEGDKIIGTLVGSIKFESISAYAAKVKVGENGYAYMIDRNGLILSHPDVSKILKENASDKANDEFKAIIEEMKAGKASEAFYTYNNVYKYTVFQPAGNWVIAVTANYNEYMAPAIAIRNNTFIIIIIAIIVAMIGAYLYSTKGIINPIKELEKLMKRAGDGDLTVKISIKSKDEIEELGNSFNEMIKHQDEIVRNVRSAAEQLNAASEEMAASSEEISATTEEVSATINQVAQDAEKQNESIVDVSGVLVQLASLVQLAQNRAKSTSSNAAETIAVADRGREKVEETVKAMNNISAGSEETAKALEAVNNLSVKVGGIITTINAIAEQTNLLALNAAIEAARAGEHGKGFSVVADEVRKLSEESDDRAKEITSLVSEMMKEIKNAVAAMERAKTEVNNGVVIVSETDKAFVNIREAIENISNHVNQILDITGDEVASSDKVVKLINDIATVTESNAANSENVSLAAEEQASAINNLTSTAEETSAMAEELTRLVEKFEI